MPGYYKPHCTSVGVAPRLPLKVVSVPVDLQSVLKKHLAEDANNTLIQNSYITCIKSFSNATDVKYDEFLTAFTISLHVETYYKRLSMLKYTIRRHIIRPMDIFNNEISINTKYVIGEQEIVRKQALVKIIAVRTNVCSLGFVKDILSPKSFTVRMLDNNVLSEYRPDETYDILFQYDNYPIKCCLNALRLVKDCDLLSLLYPIGKSTFSRLDDLNFLDKNIEKNEKQKQAVCHILHKTAYPAPYILFGPPGTGKTATIVEAIYQIWRQNSTNKILVCAPSNTAVDEITLRLLEKIPANAIYRAYAASRLWSHVHPRIHPCSSFIDRNSIMLPRELILFKRIILTTLITSTRLQALRLRANHFSHIFIDEASQATEIETIIPMCLSSGTDGGRKGRLQSQVVLAGDPYQLGPIVESRLVKNILGVPMMERLMKLGPYTKNKKNKYNASYITKLIQNYRSHTDILRVPNNLFYQGELVANEGPHTNIALNWQELPTPGFPMIFHALDSDEVRTTFNSVYNEDEIKLVEFYLTKLIKQIIGGHKIMQKDIGVVTPFKEQRCKIRQMMEANNWNGVTVGTVETFQGREKSVIIVSTVRSRSFEHDGLTHLGHLSDPKRFNVAITRAKALLIVIGNPEALKVDRCWSKLMQYCKEHGGYVDYEKKSDRIDAQLKEFIQAYNNTQG